MITRMQEFGITISDPMALYGCSCTGWDKKCDILGLSPFLPTCQAFWLISNSWLDSNLQDNITHTVMISCSTDASIMYVVANLTCIYTHPYPWYLQKLATSRHALSISVLLYPCNVSMQRCIYRPTHTTRTRFLDIRMAFHTCSMLAYIPCPSNSSLGMRMESARV